MVGPQAAAAWDRNAPLPEDDPTRTIPESGQGHRARAYREFSGTLADIATRFFTARWIDAAVRPGKAPGAFAHPTVPWAHP